MASFDRFVTKLIDQIEKGYQNDFADSGNFDSHGILVGTKYGISARTLESWRKRSISETDMRNLTKNEAIQIYKANYWNVLRCTEINSQPVADIFADMGVHAGPGAAAALMRTVLKAKGYKISAGATVNTDVINAINAADEAELHNTFKAERTERYLSSGSGYTQGWLNRLNHFPDLQAGFSSQSGQWLLWALVIGSFLFAAYVLFFRHWFSWRSIGGRAVNIGFA